IPVVPNTPCPTGITPAYTTADAAVHGTGLGKAFHITTSAPVVAYDIYPYGGGTSAVTGAMLLLPRSAWDTNYAAGGGRPASGRALSQSLVGHRGVRAVAHGRRRRRHPAHLRAGAAARRSVDDRPRASRPVRRPRAVHRRQPGRHAPVLHVRAHERLRGVHVGS